eukprot:1065683-Rhodomonas_salina.1
MTVLTVVTIERLSLHQLLLSFKLSLKPCRDPGRRRGITQAGMIMVKIMIMMPVMASQSLALALTRSDSDSSWQCLGPGRGRGPGVTGGVPALPVAVPVRRREPEW